MAWITITENDVKTRLAGAELSAYTTAARASGQANPLPEIIEQVVDEVRGYIAANKSNQLGAGMTIPQKLLRATLNMIRYQLITRLPISISAERKDDNDKAVALMQQVATGKFAVEEPVDADTELIPAPTPRFETPRRKFKMRDQDGL